MELLGIIIMGLLLWIVYKRFNSMLYWLWGKVVIETQEDKVDKALKEFIVNVSWFVYNNEYQDALMLLDYLEFSKLERLKKSIESFLYWQKEHPELVNIVNRFKEKVNEEIKYLTDK